MREMREIAAQRHRGPVLRVLRGDWNRLWFETRFVTAAVAGGGRGSAGVVRPAPAQVRQPHHQGHPAARQGAVRQGHQRYRAQPLRARAADAADPDEHLRHQRIPGQGQAGHRRQLVPRGRRARLGAGRSRVQGLHPVLSRHGRGRRSAGKDLQDAVPADGEGRPRPHCTRCAPRTSAGSCWCSSPTASSRPRRSRSCATSRKCWPTRNTGWAASISNKGSFPAAANRLQALADQFPLYSQADEALWDLADAYQRMGDRFENQQAAAYTKHRHATTR